MPTEPTDEARAWAESMSAKWSSSTERRTLADFLAAEVAPIMRERDKATSGIVEVGMELAREHEKCLRAEERARRAEKEVAKLKAMVQEGTNAMAGERRWKEIADDLAKRSKAQESLLVAYRVGKTAAWVDKSGILDTLAQTDKILARYEAAKRSV